MDDRLRKGIDRRTFLKMLGIASGVLVIPGAVACGGADPTPGPAGDATSTVGGSGSEASTATAASSPTTTAGGSTTTDVPFYDGTFTVAMLQNPQGLDPQVNTNTESFQAMLGIYEQLIDYDPISDTFYPQLIEEMPDLSNPTEFTFNLRQGVKFHDGSELTAEDVKYTFDYILEQGPKSPAYSLYNMVDSVTAVDSHTVVFTLKFASSAFLPYLASVMGGIVRKGARDNQDLTRDPSGAGCGPFKFVEWVSGDHLTFERFEDYFRPGYPKFQTLVYRIIVDDAAREAQLLSGAIDFNGFVSPKDFERLTTQTPGITGARGDKGSKVDYVMINFSHPLGQDKHIRRALALAVDGEAILKNVLHNTGTVAHGAVRPDTRWYDPAVEKLHSFDLEAAQAELAQSSHPDGFEFDLYCENNPYIVQEATLLQAMWQKINVKANVIPMEKTAFYDKCSRGSTEWFAGVSNWTSSVDTPHYMIKLVFTTDGSYQRSNYSNPELDDLVDQLDKTLDEAEQMELMSKIGMIMADDLPAIWFVWEDWLAAWKDYVIGYAPAVTYYQYFDEVAIAPH